MKLAPGSFVWLLAHDLRVSWRQLTSMFAGWSALAMVGAIAAAFVALHGLAWGALEMRESSPRLFGTGALTTAAIGALLWMIAQGLLGATRSLYERGDLDVLFASPLPEWKAVTSRALAITATSIAALAPMLLPLANVGAVTEGAHWLTLYPVLASMALAGTALGFAAAIALFQMLGARRARQISQIAAAGIAGAFVLAVQIEMLLPREFTADVVAWIGGYHRNMLSYNDAGSWLVGKLASGDFVALTSVMLFACATFGAAVAALSGAFARASQVAVGSAADETGRTRIARPFRAGAGPSLRRKEWRLLVRDPNLFAQLGLQIVYTLPLAVLLLRSPGQIPPAIALTPLIVVLAAQIAASLAWITVSGEDAPEMIATAPIGARQAAMAKLSAIAAPLAVILAMPMAALAYLAPLAALYALFFGAMAACSTALLNFWHPMAGNRRGLLRRHSQSKVIAIAEHGLALLWAVAVITAMVELAFALVPILVIAGILFLFRPKSGHGRPGLRLKLRTPLVAMQHN